MAGWCPARTVRWKVEKAGRRALLAAPTNHHLRFSNYRSFSNGSLTTQQAFSPTSLSLYIALSLFFYTHTHTSLTLLCRPLLTQRTLQLLPRHDYLHSILRDMRQVGGTFLGISLSSSLFWTKKFLRSTKHTCHSVLTQGTNK